MNTEELTKYVVGLLNKKGKVYLASGWFNPEQMERCEWVRDTLRYLGFEVFSPKDEALCTPDSTENFRQVVFDGNLEAIKNASFVLNITNGKDMGTIFEAGHAYGKVPIVYFAENLDGPFNLMLSQSGVHVLTSRDQLKSDLSNLKVLESILCCRKVGNFNGEIE